MDRKVIDITNFPVAMNTYHDVAQLHEGEVSENIGVIKLPNRELMFHPNLFAYTYTQYPDPVKYITAHYINSIYIAKQFLVFGWFEEGGEYRGVLYRLQNLNQPEVLLDNLNPYIIPCFVDYLKGVYIFLGPQGTYYYDGNTLVDKTQAPTNYPKSFCGLSFRGRLWMAGLLTDPGKVKATNIDSETMDDFDILCGSNAELINAIDGVGDSLFIFKEKEIYEFIWGDNIATGVLKKHSYNCGCSFHTLLQRKDKTFYMKNKNGVYVMNPQHIVSTGREVMVEPNIIDVSIPVKNLIRDFQQTNIGMGQYYKDSWNYEDFEEWGNIYLPYNKITLGKQTILDQHVPDENQSEVLLQTNKLYAQSFQLTQKLCIDSIYVKLQKPYTGVTKFRIALCYNQGSGNGSPGSEIVSYTFDIDADTHGTFWWLWQIYLHPGGTYILEPNTLYWIKIQRLSGAELKWKYNTHNSYSRGTMWMNTNQIAPKWWTIYDFIFLFYGQRYNKSGYVVSKQIEIPGVINWSNFIANAYIPPNTSITHYVRKYGEGDWQQIQSGGTIPSNLQNEPLLQWKAILETNDNCAAPQILSITFTACHPDTSKPLISGYRENGYYLNGYNKNDEYISLCYHTQQGWLQLNRADAPFKYSHLFEDVEYDDKTIAGVGVGLDDGAELRAVFISVQPELGYYYYRPIRIKTGKLFFDSEDTPKKLRKIFMTYQGTNVVLKVYSQNETITKILADAGQGDFKIAELNFDGERSKWFMFEITADSHFKLKDFKVEVKFLASNET